ncbi:hypothetical protein [Kitasatospora cheerisanensis]|uniref:Uncharacterized protein n=1 Tax=Kitasatospora cheerisanensis KCTC 2395 TaxID=1348663 RepID=A0A066Z5Y1_9ACTN|nr:hypothetical protein [Kitasatospora cheerisanensis]KDN85716.1 hypothetical protein KCH_25440 [Kitasatospora cheerisanensis KCTC 2395]
MTAVQAVALLLGATGLALAVWALRIPHRARRQPDTRTNRTR